MVLASLIAFVINCADLQIGEFNSELADSEALHLCPENTDVIPLNNMTSLDQLEESSVLRMDEYWVLEERGVIDFDFSGRSQDFRELFSRDKSDF